MIIFAILANVSVTAMFTAGIMPGLLVAVCMTSMAMIKAKMEGVTVDVEQPPFNLKVFLRSLSRVVCPEYPLYYPGFHLFRHGHSC